MDPSSFIEWSQKHTTEDELELYLSLGMYNLVVFCADEDIFARIVEFARSSRVSMEAWQNGKFQPTEEADTTDGTSLETDDAAEFLIYQLPIYYPKSEDLANDDAEAPKKRELSETENELISILDGLDQTKKSYLTEFLTTASVVLSRSIDTDPRIASDVSLISKAMNWLISDPDIDPDYLEEIMITANAGLSRLASQAFSGTSPITNTECHFWPHSLLGTGVANMALRNLAHFISVRIETHGLVRCIDLLMDKPFKDVFEDEKRCLEVLPQTYASLNSLDELIDDTADESEQIDEDMQTPTPMTYFSARDGFRNTALSVSAPIQSIFGCNSHSWNLATITHEISHRIVSAQLEKIMSHLRDDVASSAPSKEAIVSFFQADCLSVQDAAARLFLHVCILQDSAYKGTARFIETLSNLNADIEQLLDVHSDELEECLVHIFDFYHFYNRDTGRYIQNVFRSKAILPSLDKKLDQFLHRALLAISVQYYGIVENWSERAKDDLLRFVKHESFEPGDRVKQRIIETLEEGTHSLANWPNIQNWLVNHGRLLSLFHLLLRSHSLASHFQEEQYLASGRTEYPFRRGIFPVERTGVIYKFSNPLRMLSEYCVKDEPESSASCWLLQMLAFKANIGQK